MISETIARCYSAILNSELIEATGCTEPIALALAGAKAREALGEMPTHVDLYCSGNMIKNCKSVVVPNSGGIRGMEAGVLLGIIAGDPNACLQVISNVSDGQREQLKEVLKQNIVNPQLATNVPPLYIRVELTSADHSSMVEISGSHTNITQIIKDGKAIFENKGSDNASSNEPDKSLLNFEDIMAYGETADLTDVLFVLKRQITDNTAISQEGLTNNWGESVGKTLLAYGDDIYTRAKAAAAAGSDARMNGCPMAVVINSGSGNQGMTVSLPVIEFAKELKVSQEKLYRALAISNLIAIHQKRYIGTLSAYCGAISAAAGAGCGIAWLQGCSHEVIADTLTNDLGAISGMVCDGAKSSCALKIAAAIEAAYTGLKLAKGKHVLRSGDGLIKADVDKTVAAIGNMAKTGMKSTDQTIVEIMMEK